MAKTGVWARMILTPIWIHRSISASTISTIAARLASAMTARQLTLLA